jgi:succinate dehydrogenase / fumarate reductase iron-sulfur subunit
MPQTFRVNIQRQEARDRAPFSQTFEVERKRDMNVISVLQEIAAHPVTVDGEATVPVCWDANCLEEVCGACSMVINGKVRQACTALVDNLLKQHDAIDLKPMSKFPVVRDLVVDRRRMFDALKRVKGWIPVDTYNPIGEGPIVSPEVQAINYPLSCCMTCGCCLEVCPQINDRSAFIGPHAIGQAMLFNNHPTGAMTAAERLDALMAPGGLQDCGNAQNCVKACPKGVPLTWAIGKAGRDTTLHSIKRWFLK